MNKFMSLTTKIIEKSPFSLNRSLQDYWSYNLVRANVRIPGGLRIMKPEEFNACIKFVEGFVILIGVLIGMLFSAPIGVMLVTNLCISSLSVVLSKDLMIPAIGVPALANKT